MEYSISQLPSLIPVLEKACEEHGFTMPSDRQVGSLLKTLCLSRPGGRFLELGTGIGLSLAWMADGLSSEATLLSIDNDPTLVNLTQGYFSKYVNVNIVCADGSEWLTNYQGEHFDLIFADAWPGKYSELKEVLALLKPGGFYVVDDMNAQPNWPDGHSENVFRLVQELEERKDLSLTKINWSTGIILAVKVP